jgi:hypothetical protein
MWKRCAVRHTSKKRARFDMMTKKGRRRQERRWKTYQISLVGFARGEGDGHFGRARSLLHLDDGLAAFEGLGFQERGGHHINKAASQCTCEQKIGG